MVHRLKTKKPILLVIILLVFLIMIVAYIATRPLDQNIKELDTSYGLKMIQNKLEEYKIKCGSYPVGNNDSLIKLTKKAAPECFVSHGFHSFPILENMKPFLYQSDGVSYTLKEIN